jgi:HK97 family phage portal protein
MTWIGDLIKRYRGGNSYLFKMLGVSSGANVPVNPDSALGVTAVYACQMLIADTLAGVSWRIQEVERDGTVKDQPLNPINQLLNGKTDSSRWGFDWRHALILQLLRSGNAYAVRKRQGGVTTAFELTSYDQVSLYLNELDQLEYYETRSQKIDPADMLHIKLYAVMGLVGLSPIEAAETQIGTSLKAGQTLSSFYGNGGMPKGFISIKSGLRDKDRITAIGDNFDNAYSGSGAGKTAVLTEGAEYKNIQISTREGQFLESIGWSIEEIARIYRVPPHKIGHLEHGVYNNSIEAGNHQFITDCIRPLAEAIEWQFKKFLPRNYRLYIDLDDLMRGDIETQVNRDVSLWNIGALSVNEIRRTRGLLPVPDGDTYNQPLHMAEAQNIENGE